MAILLESLIERCKEALRDETRPCIQEELHLGYLLVYLLHKLNHEVDQLVLQHLLRMGVRDEEGYIVALLSVVSAIIVEELP